MLLFTGRPAKVNHIVSALPDGAAVVGEISEGNLGEVTVLDADGEEMPASNWGWDHFSPAGA